MAYESQEYFQYDSCVSRGICSINPRNSALQTVLVLYLRIFAKFVIELDKNLISKEVKTFILNTISETIYNPDFTDNSFIYATENFRKELPKIMDLFSTERPEINLDVEKSKFLELLKETENINNSIRFGEKIFIRSQSEIPSEIRDLYNIMLVICKSISINLLDLQSFETDYQEGFSIIIELLAELNLESQEKEVIKQKIYNASKIDCEILNLLRNAQEKRYGKQIETEVSFTTTKGNAILVVGSNIRELETILESLKEQEIDIYTHDEMMLAHTFPKFKDYSHLKGQYGLGLESCLLDFATFPGPIILTKHSLHNIENFYRGILFTTDYSSPKGVMKIENNDFSKVIEATKIAKGFKTGKQCESIIIGCNFEEIIIKINEKLNTGDYKRIFFIGLDKYTLEQKVYFEKLIKLAPKDTLIISFSYNIEKENLIHINACFDSYSLLKIFENIDFNTDNSIKTTIFIPKCDRSSISEMIYLSHKNNTKVFVGKCTPIILNPSLMNTLQTCFNIENITSSKKDIEKIIE